jgi:hypothetical protein
MTTANTETLADTLAAEFDNARGIDNLAERVIARLRAKGFDVEWAEFEVEIHRGPRIDVQGLSAATGAEVIVRVTGDFLTSNVTVGAYDAAGRFTARGPKADAARAALR